MGRLKRESEIESLRTIFYYQNPPRTACPRHSPQRHRPRPRPPRPPPPQAAPAVVLETEYRNYDCGIVSFVQSFPQGASGTNTSTPALPIVDFPAFAFDRAMVPKAKWVAWRGTMLARLGDSVSVNSSNLFGHGSDAPVFALYGAGRDTPAVVLGARNHVKHMAVSAGVDSSALSLGPRSSLPALPANFSMETFLTSGGGARQALYTWGAAMRTATGGDHSKALRDDGVISHVSVFEDNGAYLNMNQWLSNANMHYNPLSSHNATPRALVESQLAGLHELGIKPRVIQMDDW